MTSCRQTGCTSGAQPKRNLVNALLVPCPPHRDLKSIFCETNPIESIHLAQQGGGTAFDGTYQLVSSTRVNAMYTSYTGARPPAIALEGGWSLCTHGSKQTEKSDASPRARELADKTRRCCRACTNEA
jgi:hypothetical protein